MNNIPTLTTPGVVLRPLEIADGAALFAAFSDLDVQRFRKQSPHTSIAETTRYIEDTLARGLGWAITENGGEAFGRLALRVLHDGVGEFGIVLRREAQGRGFATKAIALVEGYAFNQLGLHRLV